MKFSLTANSAQNEGFKFNFQAESIEEMEICKSLSEQIIAKIEKIVIEIDNKQDFDEFE